MVLTLPGNSEPHFRNYFVVFTEFSSADAIFSVSLTGSRAAVPNPKNVLLGSRFKWPSLSGRWKDDLNGQQIAITVTGSPGGDGAQEKIIAKYAVPEKNRRGAACSALDSSPRRPSHDILFFIIS